MKKMEKRDVEVEYCDFCGNETEHLDRCAVCKQEMCCRDGGAIHTAYSVETYRYRDRHRLAGYGSRICNSCAVKKFGGTIQELFDGMMSEDPVLMIGM